MHRLVFLLALMLPGTASAASGCPILFQPGASIRDVVRACSAEGGLLIRDKDRWECRDKWRSVALFMFDLSSSIPKVVTKVSFFPQAMYQKPGWDSSTLHTLINSVTRCLGFDPDTFVLDPIREGANGLIFRWALKNGAIVTVQELNRMRFSLLLEVAPPLQKVELQRK